LTTKRDFVPWRFSDACRPRVDGAVMQASEKPAQKATRCSVFSISSMGEQSITMRYRGHTNNSPEAACADRPGRLDWFQEPDDPRTLQFGAPRDPPNHLSHAR